MFAFIQAHLKNENLLARTHALIEQISTIPQDVKAIFVSADFFRLNPSTRKEVELKSSSAYLFSLEQENCISLIQAALVGDTSIILNENERIFAITSNSYEELVYKRKNVFEVLGQVFSYSYDVLPGNEFEHLPTEFHIHYNKKPFSVNFQVEQEEYLSYFAQRAKKDTIYLNSISTYEGNIYHGQSFYVNSNGELNQRAKAFEASIMLDNLFYISPEYKNMYKLIFDALVFAIRDHVQASGLSKIVLGLSGGIDSALVAPLCVEALGKENVVGVLMPSEHSSEGSVVDAKALAQNLGIQHHVIPIKDSVDTFNVLVPIAQENTASEANSQLMLQNVQSRIRGVYLMGLANALPAFLMGTGNKSEAAMGYCTLYGDTCAGLFPLGDLYKYNVYGLAKWYNEYKEKEIIPQNSITKAPSAELAPGQKDSDSLPEYEVLDPFLYELFEGDKEAGEIEHAFTNDERLSVMKKIKSAEYKRAQIAPVVRIFDVSLGKDWK